VLKTGSIIQPFQLVTDRQRGNSIFTLCICSAKSIMRQKFFIGDIADSQARSLGIRSTHRKF